MSRKYRVGRECKSWCTKCKEILEHTVIAMVGDLPKRVKCETCGSQHNFRLPSAKPSRKSRTVSAKSPKLFQRASWETIMARLDGSAASKDYLMSKSFEVNDIIDHPNFGVGFVKNVFPGGKMEVLFEAGVKVLAHDR